ncbi:MAG: hypothetical protein LC751_15335 [Actinobacteria bacterium]|nr:hypothetical protein [Actinomycetota bacterium]MCA1737689.1 hypothetical protein [Actinomycetota bacterium]
MNVTLADRGLLRAALAFALTLFGLVLAIFAPLYLTANPEPGSVGP